MLRPKIITGSNILNKLAVLAIKHPNVKEYSQLLDNQQISYYQL